MHSPQANPLLAWLHAGLDHHAAGRHAEAERCYRAVLAADPEQPDAHNLLGVTLCQGGRPDEAVDHLRRALRRGARVPGFHLNLGNALRAAGREAEAIDAYRRALRLDPQLGDAWLNLAQAQAATGHRDAARTAFERACAATADPSCRLAFATFLREAGEGAAALRVLREGAAHDPAPPELLLALGAALESQGRPDEALGAYLRALQADPQFAPAHYGLGNVLRVMEREDDALAAYLRCLECDPGHARAANNVGLIHALRDDLPAAEAWHRRALVLDDSLPEAHLNLGCTLERQGHYDEALASLDRALELQPGYPAALANRGLALKEQGRYGAALQALDAALAADPDLDKAAINCATALFEMGEADASLDACRALLLRRPEERVALANFASTSAYSERNDAAAIFAAHRAFALVAAATVVPATHPRPGAAAGARRLRVGYVSGDLRNHSVGFFIEPVLAAHDRAQFEITAYHNHAGADAVTERLRSHCERWVEAARLSDDQLARRIRDDAMDILVDLSGHTAGNRLMVFARKPAPVQMSWLGYLTTTGLAAMDWRITDHHVDPPGFEAWQVEQPLRLDGCYVCYGPPPLAPAPLPPPPGPPVFGSFNNLAKLSAASVRLWSALLREVPDAALCLKTRALGDEAARGRVLERFAAQGIDPGRLILAGWERDGGDHLAQYHRIHVALDTFPYNGVTTTCEALWMGVPVVSLVGDTHAARQGLTLLDAVGLGEFAVGSSDAFVATAAALVLDRQRQGELRAGLRSRMQASPLTDAAAFTRRLEDAYRMAWREFCAPPRSV